MSIYASSADFFAYIPFPDAHEKHMQCFQAFGKGYFISRIFSAIFFLGMGLFCCAAAEVERYQE